jgi:hypothetical protein
VLARTARPDVVRRGGAEGSFVRVAVDVVAGALRTLEVGGIAARKSVLKVTYCVRTRWEDYVGVCVINIAPGLAVPPCSGPVGTMKHMKFSSRVECFPQAHRAQGTRECGALPRICQAEPQE